MCSRHGSVSRASRRGRSRRSAPSWGSPASGCASWSHARCASCARSRLTYICICGTTELVADGSDLAQARQPAQRLDLDLPHTLACQTEAATDLLECLRLVVGEPVAEAQHLPLALVQRLQRLLQGLAA